MYIQCHWGENGQILEKSHKISDISDQNSLISDISDLSDEFPLLQTRDLGG